MNCYVQYICIYYLANRILNHTYIHYFNQHDSILHLYRVFLEYSLWQLLVAASLIQRLTVDAGEYARSPFKSSSFILLHFHTWLLYHIRMNIKKSYTITFSIFFEPLSCWDFVFWCLPKTKLQFGWFWMAIWRSWWKSSQPQPVETSFLPLFWWRIYTYIYRHRHILNRSQMLQLFVQLVFNLFFSCQGFLRGCQGHQDPFPKMEFCMPETPSKLRTDWELKSGNSGFAGFDETNSRIRTAWSFGAQMIVFEVVSC